MNGSANSNGTIEHPRIEVVTSTFVAAGVPAGIRDLGRLLENLNNPAISRLIELRTASLRPLYRSGSPLVLETPVLVRRDDIIFATFEGPHLDEGGARAILGQAPCLLMAPPFQIQGRVSLGAATETNEALRTLVAGFLAVSDARVYDADGYLLGEGERIVVNGARVQMSALTRRHIEAFSERPGAERRTAAASADEAERASAPASIEQTRAA
jgi:hypothetical protein